MYIQDTAIHRHGLVRGSETWDRGQGHRGRTGDAADNGLMPLEGLLHGDPNMSTGAVCTHLPRYFSRLLQESATIDSYSKGPLPGVL